MGSRWLQTGVGRDRKSRAGGIVLWGGHTGPLEKALNPELPGGWIQKGLETFKTQAQI